MRSQLTIGRPSGVPLMKFTLVYDGELPSSGNKPKPKDKARIRRYMDPQLRELWEVRTDLRLLRADPVISKSRGGMGGVVPHHSIEEVPHSGMTLSADRPGVPVSDMIDLCAPIQRGASRFFPLVRTSLGLCCGLRVLFLRQEPPGRVYQGGDIDGRLKTLFDALSIPQENALTPDDATGEDPMYCLLEDDALITGIDVTSERLLATGGDPSRVHLTIEVDVRVVHPRQYNAIFAGE